MSGTISGSQGNPQLDLGSLNRLRGSLTFASYPNLNVSASFLGRGGVSLAQEGDAVEYLDAMTGGVTSPQPYIRGGINVDLLKTLATAGLWITQMQTDARVGQVTFRADASALPDFILTNASITTLGTISGNGSAAGIPFVLRGYLLMNSTLWNLL
jgi:hypothetical protein